MTSGTVEQVTHVGRIRQQLDATLERLSQAVMAPGGAHMDRLHDAVRFFGQIATGWMDIEAEALPRRGAGYGSSVVVEDIEGGTRERYTLMTGALLNPDAGHVSLASPIGQSLLGRVPGDVIEVRTPHRHRRLRVVTLLTLQQRMDAEVPTLPAA